MIMRKALVLKRLYEEFRWQADAGYDDKKKTEQQRLKETRRDIIDNGANMMSAYCRCLCGSVEFGNY